MAGPVRSRPWSVGNRKVYVLGSAGMGAVTGDVGEDGIR